MKDVLYRLENNHLGEVIFDDIPLNVFEAIKKELVDNGSKKTTILSRLAKIIRKSDENYTVYAISYNQDYIKSSRLIKTEADVMLISAKNIDEKVEQVKERADSQTKRLIHNLKSLSAKISQEVFYVALQTDLMAPHKEALSYLERQISEKPKDAAKALLTILKYSTAQNTEFVAFQKLNGEVRLLKKEQHKIHKILMSIFYLFFQDFTDMSVHVDVEKSDLEGTFDYDSVHVCIYHLVENAAKYVKLGSRLSVYISKASNELNIEFDMQSLVIYEDELERIFKEGYSGRLATADSLNGSGIGLFLARRMACINGGNLVVINGTPKPSDPKFARNKFTLTLPA